MVNEKITVYTSNYCGHAMSVERFLADHEIDVNYINIDGDPSARETLIGINGGYASVPTLVFADGTKLTEPSFRALREKLGIESPGLLDKVWGLFRD